MVKTLLQVLQMVGIALVALAVFVATLVAELKYPTNAEALAYRNPQTCVANPEYTGYTCDYQLSNLGYFKGWANVQKTPYCGGVNPLPAMLEALAKPKDAWHWTGSGWTHRTVAQGKRVYVAPFAANWSWVWAQNTGWLAMHDADLVLNYTGTCNYGGAMPV